MRHFRLIKKYPDVERFREELRIADEYWSSERAGTSAQRETKGIELRRIVHDPKIYIGNNHRSERTALYDRFPLLAEIMEAAAREAKGDLSRAVIANLDPRGKVYQHTDWGQYYRIRDRYHLVLRSEGSYMRSGDEEQIIREGELWWFDNKVPHETRNDGDHPRVHLIFDVLPDRNRPIMEMFLKKQQRVMR